jgi:nucleotide-binding universal stress UspA family protein
MILIGYDGSQDAQAAADEVTRLFHDKPATVLTVWEPYSAALVRLEMGLGSGFGVGYERTDDTEALDAQLLQEAQRTAEQGARRLRAAGMRADPLVQERDGSIARTVLGVAARVDAEAVIVGTRGRGAAKSALLGSVSHDLAHHADRAVVVVPSSARAHRRETWTPPAAKTGQRNLTTAPHVSTL